MSLKSSRRSSSFSLCTKPDTNKEFQMEHIRNKEKKQIFSRGAFKQIARARVVCRRTHKLANVQRQGTTKRQMLLQERRGVKVKPKNRRQRPEREPQPSPERPFARQFAATLSEKVKSKTKARSKSDERDTTRRGRAVRSRSG